MARTARLDAPGAVQVRARGIEKRLIFLDDIDRGNLLKRLAKLVESRALEVLAWALMPNHFHLLVRTGNQPLQRSMRALLAGDETWFNRRYQRAGHLFQNRYTGGRWRGFDAAVSARPPASASSAGPGSQQAR